MNWQLLGLSFITVFLSELGDKSQLAAIALGSSSKSPRAVFFGTATALLLATLIGVVVGGGAAEVLPTRWLKAIAAIGFAIMGLRLLLPRPDVAEDSE
ncbi:TMEM165/GDT1 family protein [Kamptonema sp. UHCC 0994]|uniref:TMEM165/GDT1 family protein n=1 Tax=Kamptonema sp. UHCC 0994 TaxID=3031329 RepID=UPI0023B9E796|nr:TMEM165/GDT1 family protein [Kamptonema sp. UHCC 0994]MDF0552357.1 TMEM165/GDT1 family protein [Kamptonema sp. UHCC 0994]